MSKQDRSLKQDADLSQSLGDVEKLSPVQRALFEQRKLRARLAEAEAQLHEPIAVIGLGCRFPGAPDPAAFWELLRNGVDAISTTPTDRWDVEALYDPDPNAPGKIATRFGGFLEQVDQFDAAFFGISRREAASMDPQQRLLLEVAWESLEHAGYAPRVAGTSTGVFVGVASSDFAQLSAQQVALEELDAYTATGYSHSVASGRIAYAFGLQGPAITVDTACSSSLVAVHLACQSVRAGDCRIALAGGVNHVLAVENMVSLSRAQMMAPDGRCKTFDAAANGFVRAEGCGLLVLKRLSHARADGDRVLAVIPGSATNQDGRSTGLTVPNGPAQQAVIRKALENARVAPAEVSYIEAHGTGTRLGDPIEVQALGEVLGEGRSADNKVRIGSVKTNVGHTESAAGVCGLIKVVLSLVNGEIPRSLHFREPSPEIAWGDYPFLEVASEPLLWDGPGRVAGVSSFGFGGTNAHLILAEAPAEVPEPGEAIGELLERPLHVLALSGRTDAALRDLVGQYVTALEGQTEPAAFADVCYTAGAGRRHFEHRLAVTAESVSAARSRLESYLEGKTSPALVTGAQKLGSLSRVAFLYTGQGVQKSGMGRELYETQPTFRDAIDRCAAILEGTLDRPLLGLLYGEGEEAALLGETAYTQPALFALEYAVSELWRSWGLIPSVVMGHSLGEFAAACVAGVFSLEAGLRIVVERGRLMASLPLGGMMAAVFTDEQTLLSSLKSHPEVELAGVNGPANVVISGPNKSVDAVMAEFLARGIESRRLEISNSFHSSLVDPVLDAFEAFVGGFELHEPRIPIVSNVTGKLAQTGELTNPSYWRNHLRQPVLFHQGMQTLADSGAEFFVETGPHGTLLGLGQECVEPGRGVWLPTLRRERADWEQVLETISQLYAGGVEIDWRGFDADYPRSIVDLPTYSFQRTRHWFKSREDVESDKAPGSNSAERDNWQRTVAVARSQSRLVPIDLDLPRYEELWQTLDRLTVAHIAATLHTLGAYRTAGESHTSTELCEQLHVAPGYLELLEEWLEQLAGERLLERHGDGFRCHSPLEPGALAECWREAEAQLVEFPVLRDYLRRCGDRLPELMTGQASALETLFPDGSFETAEYYYRNWALARYFNCIVSRAVSSWVEEVGGDPVTILEIGAGSGGTTSSVLSELPSGSVDYWFTDLSDHFFHRAAREFAEFPFLHFARFDAELDPVDQGFAAGGFDIVLAANSLHATKDLRQAIEHSNRLLRPGGLLVLYEVTRPLTWFPMSYALMDGFQRHEDELRPSGALLQPEGWDRALRGAGFDDVAIFPEADSPAEILGHHVILARKPAEVDDTVGTPMDVAPAQRQVGPLTPGPGGASSASLERVFDSEIPAGESEGLVPAAEPTPSLAAQLQAAPASDRVYLAVDYVRQHVMDVLRLEENETPDRKDRLMDLGFDSLMAVELKGRLVKALDGTVDLPSTLIFDYPTIEAIAGLIRHQLEGPANEAGEAASESAASAAIAQQQAQDRDIAELSEEEVERLMMQKLDEVMK
jgi:acyl transferase domain-containing protein/SAM-dependent methyltransferase/acyl carrier protein